jgi:hypothetical protein
LHLKTHYPLIGQVSQINMSHRCDMLIYCAYGKI